MQSGCFELEMFRVCISVLYRTGGFLHTKPIEQSSEPRRLFCTTGNVCPVLAKESKTPALQHLCYSSYAFYCYIRHLLSKYCGDSVVASVIRTTGSSLYLLLFFCCCCCCCSCSSSSLHLYFALLLFCCFCCS